MTKRKIYLSVFILLLFAALYIGERLKQSEVPQLNLSTIVLKDLNGKPINLAAFLGNPMVINFWGTWCGPCRKELPGFNSVKQKYNGRINFVLLSDEPVEQLTAFRDANNYDFLYIQSQKKLNEMGIASVPVTFFYDAKGAFITVKKGDMSERELEVMITGMIK